jgi:hypothetical protein
MAKCEFMDECSFFTHEVGYSPELMEEMKERFCYGDWASCVPLEAGATLPVGTVPRDLLPTDHERLRKLSEFAEKGILPDPAETTPHI